MQFHVLGQVVQQGYHTNSKAALHNKCCRFTMHHHACSLGSLRPLGFLMPCKGTRCSHASVNVLLLGHPGFVQVTLLAAGFVIGPSGHSIRAICEKSGANIQVRLSSVFVRH